MYNGRIIQLSRSILLFSIVFLIGIGAPTVALTQSQPTHKSADAKKNAQAKTKTKKPAKVQQLGGGESTAERNSRLTRECKGRPNAGACEGFGQ
jgi:hypothetical protein